MRIVIPTWRRTQQQFTYFALPDDLRDSVTFVVRPEEAEEMRQRYPRADVLVLPQDVLSLPATRQWILERFSSERFVMADDDISWFKERRREEGSFPKVETDVHAMLARLEELLNIGAGLASPTPTWIPPDVTRWPVRPAGQCIQFVMVDGPRLAPLGLRYDRVSDSEDVDFLLQVLSHGINCLQLQDVVFYTANMGADAGGNAVAGAEERLSRARRGMDEVAALWPRYVWRSKRDPSKHTVQRSQLLNDARDRMSDEDKKTFSEVTEPPRRRRGRPPGSGKPDSEKRSEKLILNLTKDEMRSVMVAAANDPSGPRKVTEWARELVLDAAEEEQEPEGEPTCPACRRNITDSPGGGCSNWRNHG